MNPIALHGATAPVHDWVARSEGDFARAMDALTRAGAGATVRTTLTRANARLLPELARLLGAHRVARWIVGFPAEPFDTAVFARYALSMPSALLAIDRARADGIEAWLEDAPLCLMGRFRDRARTERRAAFGARCAGCEIASRCPGVPSAYLARFGDAELVPIHRAPPEAAP
ncbi:MAG: hypothetical protein AB7S26_29505 [Sandaracinaceae bacterium]